jgi:hypothetical protein
MKDDKGPSEFDAGTSRPSSVVRIQSSGPNESDAARSPQSSALRPAWSVSESARMASAAEARFRIDAPNAKPKRVKVIALDRPSEAVVKRLAQQSWNGASFFTASAFAGALPAGSFSMQGWLSDLAGRAKDLIDEVNTADLVVMVATAGENAQAAALIGEACSLERITTTGLILGGASASDEMLSKTLSQMRPWSLMLVIAGAVDYIEDMLVALRA